jgi:hypothetical protein
MLRKKIKYENACDFCVCVTQFSPKVIEPLSSWNPFGWLYNGLIASRVRIANYRIFGNKCTQLPAGCSKSVQCGAIVTVSSFRSPCKLLDEKIVFFLVQNSTKIDFVGF